MKKILLFILLFISFISNSNSQSLIRDAIKICDASDQKDAETVIKILGPYAGMQGTGTTISKLTDFFRNSGNTLVVDYLNFKFSINGGQQPSGKVEETTVGNIGTVSPGSDIFVMTFNALGKLYLERSRENGGIYLVEKFTGFMKKDKTASTGANFLQTLFPKTTDLITNNVLSIDNYQYTNTLQLLRESFGNDFNNFMNNIPAAIDVTKDSLHLDASQREMLNFLKLAVKLYSDLSSGTKVQTIIENLPTASFEDTTITNILKFSKIASKTLREAEGSTDTWIKFEELNSFLTNKNNANLFLGLVCEKYKDEKVIDGKTLQSFLNNTAHFQKVIKYFRLLSENVDIIQSMLKEFKEKKNSAAGVQVKDYVNLADKFGDVVISFLKIEKLDTDEQLIDKNLTAQLYEIKKETTTILTNISDKKYYSAFSGVLFMYSSKFGGLKNKGDGVEEVLKYGRFIAQMCEADSQEDVDRLIESLVLPAGSFKMKRFVNFNFGLNGYLGFIGGAESTESPFTHGNGYIGITAPLGLELSWSTFEKSSFSLYLPLLDISAPVSYRAADNSTESPAFTLKDLIAPGIFAIWGFDDVPVSAGFGMQYGPLVKKINEATGETKREWRVGLTIAFDIPLINFYTTPQGLKEKK